MKMESLSLAVQSRVPVLLWGPPGAGKSASVAALAKAMDFHLEVVIASLREPADFAGLPVVRESGVSLEAPSWARRLASYRKGILFLDEISTAPPAVQAALLRVVLDRVVGDLPLPPGVAVVAAANPPEQAAGGWDLTPPLANRFCHQSWAVNAQDWVEGILGGWPAPKIPVLSDGWESGIPAARAAVGAFIHHRPHLLLQVPTSEQASGRAWPSPRTWEMAGRLLAAASAAGAEDDAVGELVAGCVGEGAGLEFLAWRRAMDLPDPEQVLANPGTFQIPSRGDQAFAVLTAVVAAAVGNLTQARWMAAWEVLARAGEQGARDIAAVAAKALTQARKDGLPLPEKQLQGFIPLLQKGGLLKKQ